MKRHIHIHVGDANPLLVAYQKATGEYNRLRDDLRPLKERLEKLEARQSRFGGPENKAVAEEASRLVDQIYPKQKALNEARERLLKARKEFEQAGSPRDSTYSKWKLGQEYEGRLFFGAYSWNRVEGGKSGKGHADPTAPYREIIRLGRERYNAIRVEFGLPPVTNWRERPAQLIQRLPAPSQDMAIKGTKEDGTGIVYGGKWYRRIKRVTSNGPGKYFIWRHDTKYTLEGGKHGGGARTDWFLEGPNITGHINVRGLVDALNMLENM